MRSMWLWLARTMGAVLTTVIIFFVVFGLMMTASTWSSLLFPVAKITVTGGYWEGNNYVISGVLDKYRGCEFVGMTMRDAQTGREFTFTTPQRPPGQTSSRPAVEAQPFEDWIVVDPPAHGARVNMFTHHKCHELWDTFSAVGSFDISPKEFSQ